MLQEKRIYTDNWLGISFSDLDISLSRTSLATSEFYSCFYKKFFINYSNYNDLPADYLRSKKETSQELLRLLNSGNNVLSYGCGIGTIENFLIKDKNINLYLFDFAKKNTKWIEGKYENVHILDSLNLNTKYDTIYLCQVLYSLKYNECINLLKKLKNYLSDNGQIIIINNSYENLLSQTRKSSIGKLLFNNVKDFIRPLYNIVLSKLIRKEQIQFWGWERTYKRYQQVLKGAQLKFEYSFIAANQSFIIAKLIL